MIHGPVLPDAVMKTRIRRLYDIANILQSLKLIKKVQVTEMNGCKKPAFEYTGPNVRSMGKSWFRPHTLQSPNLTSRVVLSCINVDLSFHN